jgi:hypothetical protein
VIVGPPIQVRGIPSLADQPVSEKASMSQKSAVSILTAGTVLTVLLACYLVLGGSASRRENIAATWFRATAPAAECVAIHTGGEHGLDLDTARCSLRDGSVNDGLWFVTGSTWAAPTFLKVATYPRQAAPAKAAP